MPWVAPSRYTRARSLRVLWDKLRLLKTMIFLESLGFFKMCLKSWYLQSETKFFPVIFSFFLEILTTLWTMQCPNYLFHMDNHIDQVMCVSFVEKVSRWNSASKNIYNKKKLIFFGLLVKDIKISYIFYKIQNFQGPSWASIFATCLTKHLRAEPLEFLLGIMKLT